MRALVEGRTAIISDAVNRPAPRLIEAIEQLARQLHPEAFSEKRETGKGKMEKGGSPISGVFQFPFSNFHFPSAERAQ